MLKKFVKSKRIGLKFSPNKDLFNKPKRCQTDSIKYKGSLLSYASIQKSLPKEKLIKLRTPTNLELLRKIENLPLKNTKINLTEN